MPLPTVWFNKSFSPTLHQIRALKGHARTLASHTSADSIMLLEADEAFLEPKGLMGDGYVAYCLDLCRERGVQVFIPHKEMLALAARRADFEAAGTQLVVAGDPATLDLLDDKARFGAALPAHIGRVPETVVVQNWPQMRAAIDDLRTRHRGVCVKPARGIYGFGFRVLTAEPELKRFLDGDLYVMSEGQAEALFAPQPELPPLLVMELLPGVERSVDCVAWRGELAGATVRRKVGGLGNVQELEDHPELVEVARALTAHHNLSGLFNIQFKEDVQGRPVVLEINPRASGGLRTSMASGLNFPWVAVQLALGLIRPHGAAPDRAQGCGGTARLPTARPRPGMTAGLETRVALPAGELRVRVTGGSRDLHELLDFGVRQNPKRGFLFVSRVLGKHLAVRPGAMLDTHTELAALLDGLPGPVVAVGLAETATALGQGVACALAGRRGEPVLSLNSTRYRLPGWPTVTFEEAHSHATTHHLHLPQDEAARKLLKTARTLLLIDDEISTGATLRALATAMLPHAPNLNTIRLVSLTDFLGAGRAALLAGFPRPTESVALLHGAFTFTPDPGWQVQTPAVQGGGAHLAPASGARVGEVVTGFPAFEANLPNIQPGERVRVLGSGEFQFRPFLLALELERRGVDVRFHASTRSPVLPFRPIHNRAEFRDNYGEGIPNYLYNLEARSGERVLMVFETPPSESPAVTPPGLRVERVYMGEARTYWTYAPEPA